MASTRVGACNQTTKADGEVCNQSTKAASVEDYDSTVSLVIPFSRRHAQLKKTSMLDTLPEGASDSGYEPSQHSSQLSPIVSRTASPANDKPSEQQTEAEQQRPPPPQQQQQQQQYHQQQQQQQQHYHHHQHQQSYHRDYQRYYNHERDSHQPASTPMQRRVSSLSAQTSSSSSSNATPSGSRPNSVKAAGSRDPSPAIHKHQPSHGAETTADPSGDPNCDCSQCKTKTSPHSAQNGLSTAWNINYPPFTTAHHTPPYGNYTNVSPMRSYDYGYGYPPTPSSAEPGNTYNENRRPRDRPMPARPLSYGGANPVTTSSSWAAYNSYYGQSHGQAQAVAQQYSTSPYTLPPINTSISQQSLGNGPYPIAGGYSSSHGYPQDYWPTTPTVAVPGSTPTVYDNTMHSHSARRTATRFPGIQSGSPRNPTADYSQKHVRKYAEEYADHKHPEKYAGGHDRFSRRYADEYVDKYDEKYADYSQTASPLARRASQRTNQGSGAYGHLREEAVPVRSTSVPPSETGPIPPPEERRRTKTPGPPAQRMRRDSTSTPGSANPALVGALTRVPKPNEYMVYGDEFSRTPPSHHGHSRYPSRHDNRYENRYDNRYGDYYKHHRNSHIYRGSDSGISNGGVGEEELAAVTSDGETESYTMRQPLGGLPVLLPPTQRHSDEQSVETFSNHYRYMPQPEYAPRKHELALHPNVPVRVLNGAIGNTRVRSGGAHGARRYSLDRSRKSVSPRRSHW